MRVLDSTNLLFLTSTLTVISLVVCWHYKVQDTAPTLPGIDWSSEERALLVAYRPQDGCGCTDTLSADVSTALQAKQKVYFLGDKRSLVPLRQKYAKTPSTYFIIYNLNELPIAFRSKQSVALMVESGRLSYRR